jgi:hypothetical protein
MLSNRLGFHLRRGIEKALRARYLPSGNPGDVAQRQRVIESIPTLKPPFNGLWNSFAIRQLIHSPGNEPTFFVALATKRCST